MGKTERGRAETSRLAHSESAEERDGSLAEAIVETVRTPLLVLDADLRVMRANEAFYRTFELTPERTEGQLLYELSDNQWDIPLLREMLDKILPVKTTLEDYQVEYQLPDGGLRIMQLNARRIQESQTRPAQILLSVEDITERRKAAEELKRHSRELERSNDALQEFARVVSHDLQEPLRKIVAFGNRLEAAAGESLDEAARGYLDRVMNASDRMHVLINDLLTLSRVTTRGEEFTDVDLNLIVKEALVDLETRIAETEGVVEVGSLPTIEADPIQMRQLFQNLIGNGLKFHRADVPPKIAVTCQTDGDGVEVTISDNGIGFEQKYADKIFELFQRLQTRDYQGTGTGLAICRTIARRHGGEIRARGSQGQGSTFVITLPATQSR